LEGLLIILAVAYFLVLPVLTLIAWSRASSHASQITELRKTLQELESRFASLQMTAWPPQASPTRPSAAKTTAESPVVATPSKDEAPTVELTLPELSLAPSASETDAPASEDSRPDLELPSLELPVPDLTEALSTRTMPELVGDAGLSAPAVHLDAAPMPAEDVAPVVVATTPVMAEEAPAPEQPRRKRAERPPRTGPSLPERMLAGARNWLLGGNTIVRVGMLLVFLGLAFLLRYASDRVVIPLEVRYLAVATTALLALALGWRLRTRRPAYALSMQGGAVAVMYLTVFAALKLHDQPLLSTQAGFALLVTVVALSAVLAVAQDAISLAAAGALGGFATPVLLSTGGGNHVALFTYFALLNTGILAIAWFKAWRPLNLIGFFGTFTIGLAWGLRSYDPALHYASTQPFLILFFLMFVAIGMLFARRMLLDDADVPTTRDAADWRAWLARHGHAAQRYVDGTLLFGTPIVGFGLQYALVSHIEYGAAFSSLALGLFYLLLAQLSHGSNPLRHRLLTEVFLALGMIFASLAIPLGLDAQWTSAAWAVEAAGLYWIGHRQQRPLTRAFALMLQVGALISFGQELAPGAETVLAGSALGALLIGLSFVSNLLVLRRQPEDDQPPLWDRNYAPLFSILGLWCLFLVAPLLCAADRTALIWGLAGVATLFGGLQWRLPAWVGNAIVVQIGGAALFATSLEPANDTMLVGITAIAGLLGIAFLANAAQLRLHPAVRENERPRYAVLRPLLSTFGLWSLYLVAPLQLTAEHTAAAWALAGLATTFAGLRLQARGWVANALIAQLLAGILFLSHMRTDAAAGGVLALADSGWQGLVIASLIGLASLASLGAAIRAAQRQNNPAYVTRLAWALLFGLGFIALAVLFILPWQTATAVWAGCGFLLMWAAMRIKLKPPFWFALALEAIAGAAFLKSGGPNLAYLRDLTTDAAVGPFAHAGFWTPIVIALAAFAVAWRLHAYARSPAAQATDALDIDAEWLSRPALLWAAGWWAFAWLSEWARLDGTGRMINHPFLATMAASVLLLLAIAHRWRWSQLAGLSSLLLPLAALTAAFDYQEDVNLFGVYGWLAYGLALAAGFALLRASQTLLSEQADQLLHLTNSWVWLAAASLEMRYLFLALGEPGSTWRWLGWVLPLAAWLLWNARQTPPRLWPATRYPSLYRFGTTTPLLVILLAWLALANIGASGNAAPLPFLPFFNPLDLALVLILFSGWQWLQQLRRQDKTIGAWHGLHRPLQPALLAGAFLTYTCAVLRGAHHLAGIPWQPDAMQQSMLVQASLSIAWALLALGMMVAGHRSTRRAVWITGAVLVAVVVAKLFFIELSNRGGLERIVSFIGVGLLLLVVGYFAPLPPTREAKS
jgi:uncharacterized membrane protein